MSHPTRPNRPYGPAPLGVLGGPSTVDVQPFSELV